MHVQVNKNNVYVSLSDSFTMAHTVVHATWWHSFTWGPAINLPNILLLADPTFVMVSSQHEESRSLYSSYHTSTSAWSPRAHFKVSWGHQSWLSARIFTHVHAWKRLDFRKSVSVPGLVWCWSYSDKLWVGPPKYILNTGSASKITWILIFLLSYLSNNTFINSQFNSIPVFWCNLWMNLHQQIMLSPLGDEPLHPVLTSCILFPSLVSSGVAPLRCALAPLSPSSFKQLADPACRFPHCAYEMGLSHGEKEIHRIRCDIEQGTCSGDAPTSLPTLPLKDLTAQLLRMIRGQRENEWKTSEAGEEGGRSEEVSIKGKEVNKGRGRMMGERGKKNKVRGDKEEVGKQKENGKSKDGTG